MSTNNHSSSSGKTPRRDRQQTESVILEAVGKVLVRDGFASLGINAIAREAGVDKVLIYRYFGGMTELLQAFGSHGSFWPTVDELFEGIDLASLPFDTRLQIFIDRMIDALRERPLTLEILAMEVGAPNALSDILNATLENWGQIIAQRLAVGYSGDISQFNILMAIQIAGIQYLLLRARNTALFSGIPIREDAGWQMIKQSLSWMCTRIAPEDSPP